MKYATQFVLLFITIFKIQDQLDIFVIETQFPNNVIITKTNVPLHQTYVTLLEFVCPFKAIWMLAIFQTYIWLSNILNLSVPDDGYDDLSSTLT